jgi:hypothetical protein
MHKKGKKEIKEQKVDKYCASIVATMHLIVPRWDDLVTKETDAENLKQIHFIVATMAHRSSIPRHLHSARTITWATSIRLRRVNMRWKSKKKGYDFHVKAKANSEFSIVLR